MDEFSSNTDIGEVMIYFSARVTKSSKGSEITISILLSKTSSSRRPDQSSFAKGDGESGIII